MELSFTLVLKDKNKKKTNFISIKLDKIDIKYKTLKSIFCEMNEHGSK